MADRPHSDEEIEAAVAALTDPDRLEGAQNRIAHVVPQLQHVLAEALAAGGWFDQAHESELLKAAGIPDVDERVAAVRTLVAEETRIGMLVGVAVGYELALELQSSPDQED